MDYVKELYDSLPCEVKGDIDYLLDMGVSVPRISFILKVDPGIVCYKASLDPSYNERALRLIK